MRAVGPSHAAPLSPLLQLLFVTSREGLTILKLSKQLKPKKVGYYDSVTDDGRPTGVAYSEVNEELAISVSPTDPLRKGKLYIVSDVEKWVE